MTRKDHIKFARMLNERENVAVLWDDDGSCRSFFQSIVEKVGDILLADNKQFDRYIFEEIVYTGKEL